MRSTINFQKLNPQSTIKVKDERRMGAKKLQQQQNIKNNNASRWCLRPIFLINTLLTVDIRQHSFKRYGHIEKFYESS